MIQDIFPQRFDNHYYEAAVSDDCPMLLYREKNACVRLQENTLSFPLYGQVKEALTEVVYLFSIDDTRYFGGVISEEFMPPEEFTFENVALFRTATPRDRAFACVTGHQLYLWYRDNRFCGRCATPLLRDQQERMLRCPHCGGMIFPRINPAVIVAVTNGDRLLMTKYTPGRGNPARYALIAGFTEIGETVEQTVQREVMEEVGLQVKNLRYYKSQPWTFSGSLLMGFFCQVDGDDTIRLDATELSVGEWVPREQVPDDSSFDASLTREMMGLFHRGQELR